MEQFIELLHYQFFMNAVYASIFTSISCGIIGTYIVSKRIVFISGGITHASFGGIGMGYFFGFSPILGAMIFSILSALGIEFMSKKTDVREDFYFPNARLFGKPDELPFREYIDGFGIKPHFAVYPFGCHHPRFYHSLQNNSFCCLRWAIRPRNQASSRNHQLPAYHAYRTYDCFKHPCCRDNSGDFAINHSTNDRQYFF